MARRADKERSGIFVTVRFWSDYVQPSKKYVPKKAWAAGTLYVQASKSHRIPAGRSVMFNSLEEMMVQLHKVLKNQGITLLMKTPQGELAPRLGKGYPLGNPWYPSQE